MCGIAGFSLSEHSKVNSRALAHELLAAIEYRGSDASGYAWTSGNDSGIYKDRLPGSQLPLSGLPRNAKQVILHTRLATQGSVYDNRNNHPVISPSGKMALVHNGVISNDDFFRDRFPNLPAVDSAVLPALIEADGVDALADAAGYAAIAWLDGSEDADMEILHLAKIDYSPVAYTWLLDGSFVWASTVPLLAYSIAVLGLEHGHIFELNDGDYFQVKRGVILDVRNDVTMSDDWSAWQRYGAATSGNRATNQGSESAYRPRGIGSSFGNVEYDQSVFDDDDDDGRTWEEDAVIRAGKRAMSLDPESNGGYATFYEDGREVRRIPIGQWAEELEEGDLFMSPEDGGVVGYYVTGLDGSPEIFSDLDDLEGHLSWLSSMTMYDGAPRADIEHSLKWVNWITDLGHISAKDNFVSWVENLAEIDQHEPTAVYTLNYVRDGVGELLMMRG